ncbi:MAG: YunG family protein [Gaiellaceae bacterium]
MFTLAQLEQAIRASWRRDTADPANDWSPRNPSCGHCDITSLVVHDLLGGELLGADVFLDGERVEAHMWNRLGSGIEVDLTRDQFIRGEVVGQPVVRARPATFDPAHPRYHRYEKYLVLSQRVRACLGLPDEDEPG